MEKPTNQQISDKRDRAADSVAEDGNKYPGMTYTEGIRDALEWVLGDTEDDLEV